MDQSQRLKTTGALRTYANSRSPRGLLSLEPAATKKIIVQNESMKIIEAQYERITGHSPIQRGNVKARNRDFINAIEYMAKNGRKWRAFQ